MLHISPQSPEARRSRQRGTRDWFRTELGRLRPGPFAIEVVKRVAIGTYTDGFIHAGNLAYLTLVALFPFFIVAAAAANLFGQTEDGVRAVNAFLLTVPRNVADVLEKPISDVLSMRTGNLLWFGAIVGLWTVGSLIETLRDIVRRAYGTTSTKPFWHYRLASIGIIIVSVFAILFAFSLQVMIGAADQFVHSVFPFADQAIALMRATRLVPTVILFLALYYLFVALTPSRYKDSRYPKWPGAALTTAWWYWTGLLLPVVLGSFADYNLTYGGLAGAMVTLIFFFIIGLGVVIGAELNAALTEVPDGDEQDGTAEVGDR
jgi:membrane protein